MSSPPGTGRRSLGLPVLPSSPGPSVARHTFQPPLPRAVSLANLCVGKDARPRPSGRRHTGLRLNQPLPAFGPACWGAEPPAVGKARAWSGLGSGPVAAGPTRPPPPVPVASQLPPAPGHTAPPGHSQLVQAGSSRAGRRPRLPPPHMPPRVHHIPPNEGWELPPCSRVGPVRAVSTGPAVTAVSQCCLPVRCVRPAA